MSKPKDSARSERPAETIHVRDSGGEERPARRTFPGPRGATDLLRVAVERSAYAELIAHAKGSLEAEVCGVLAGQVCADDEGAFVHVEAVIRGTAASEGSTHVTFTQDTWNAIHKVLEHDYPRLKIVGWYHTHPGFGVEFSEMDLFIQRNFFAGPAQIALVTDPVHGDVAICINRPEGIGYLNHFWIDGREQPCRAPDKSTKYGRLASGSELEPGAVQSLEARVSQLLHAMDEMRNFHYRFLMTCGFLFSLALITAVGYSIYSQWHSRLEPPKVNQIVPVPVQIGDKTVILGIGITTWDVPPELNAMLLEAEMLKREAAEKAAKAEAQAQGSTNTAQSMTNTAQSATNATAPATNIPAAASKK